MPTWSNGFAHTLHVRAHTNPRAHRLRLCIIVVPHVLAAFLLTILAWHHLLFVVLVWLTTAWLSMHATRPLRQAAYPKTVCQWIWPAPHSGAPIRFQDGLGQWHEASQIDLRLAGHFGVLARFDTGDSRKSLKKASFWVLYSELGSARDTGILRHLKVRQRWQKMPVA